MKIINAVLFIVLLTLFSCSHIKENHNKAVDKSVVSTNADSLYNEVFKMQSEVSYVKYNVRRVDTFDVDKIWDNQGSATLQRNSNDSIFGFSYYGKRNDVDRENYYIENRLFQVSNVDRTYRIQSNLGYSTLGSPGSQMVVVDMLNLDFFPGEISVKHCENGNYIITKQLVSPDSSLYKRQIFIDNTSLMPFKVHECRECERLGSKQTTTYYISDIKIDDQVKRNELSEMAFLSEYTQIQDVTDKSADYLLQKKMSNIVFLMFGGDSLKFDDIKSKVVLLDFWELWCGPCIQALPKIEKLSNKFDPNDLIIIGIVSENIENAKSLILNEDITFLQAEGNPVLKSKLMVNSFPRYILIDQNRAIKKIYYGYSDEIENDIRAFL